MELTKAALALLHTPILYILGGATDVAYANGMDDFARITAVPAMVASLNVGHGGTFFAPDGGKVTPVDIAWLDWQLKGDRAASAWFVGADCRLCTDTAWTVSRKRLQRVSRERSPGRRARTPPARPPRSATPRP